MICNQLQGIWSSRYPARRCPTRTYPSAAAVALAPGPVGEDQPAQLLDRIARHFHPAGERTVRRLCWHFDALPRAIKHPPVVRTPQPLVLRMP